MQWISRSLTEQVWSSMVLFKNRKENNTLPCLAISVCVIWLYLNTVYLNESCAHGVCSIVVAAVIQVKERHQIQLEMERRRCRPRAFNTQRPVPAQQHGKHRWNQRTSAMNSVHDQVNRDIMTSTRLVNCTGSLKLTSLCLESFIYSKIPSSLWTFQVVEDVTVKFKDFNPLTPEFPNK